MYRASADFFGVARHHSGKSGANCGYVVTGKTGGVRALRGTHPRQDGFGTVKPARRNEIRQRGQIAAANVTQALSMNLPIGARMPTSAMPSIECVELADVGIRAPIMFGFMAPMRVHSWRLRLSMNRKRVLFFNGLRKSGSWPQLASEIWKFPLP